MNELDVLIIGGGFAGLLTAVHFSGLKVAIVHPDILGHGTSSIRAKGGLAAATSAQDSVELHARDTARAGAGHGDPVVIREITHRGPFAARKLAQYGVPFERDDAGKFVLQEEADHAMPRVLSATGSRTGQAIVQTLLKHIAESDIRSLEGWKATDLLMDEGDVRGAVFSCETMNISIRAREVVLATGGACGLWKSTSAPDAACGEGLGMAYRAGARLRDLEFVQFHPTATKLDGQILLLTEALRGAGAVLVDDRGHRIMEGVHSALDLAPRDLVSRRVEELRKMGRTVFIDVTEVKNLERRFPQAHRAALQNSSSKIPVQTCAHYHMGGIATDLEGRTSVPGLWAVGEVANTGLHGANRLASNSLLEIAVVAPAAASAIRRNLEQNPRRPGRCVQHFFWSPDESHANDNELEAVRSVMDTYLGVYRSTEGLRTAVELLAKLPDTHAVTAARLIANAALKRDRSLGAHFVH